MVWLAGCSDVRAIFRDVDVDGVDGFAASTTSRLRGRVGRRERRGASPNSTPAKGLTQTLRLTRDVEDCSLAAFGDDARAGARSRGRAHSLLRELLCAAAEERTRGCAAFRNHSISIREGRSVSFRRISTRFCLRRSNRASVL